ncbi:MAG: hypothetical protein JOZ75_07680 [Candidatus Dormibacteraeota bacterium]|nr:hypothetical protein [Candidatus Dormibacteraeota bacterium]
MADLLFVAPGGSGAAAFLVTASSTLQSRTPSASHAITALHLNAATRAAVDAAIRSNESLLYFGHAERDELGDAPDIVVDLTNVGGVSGVIVAMGCHSAAGLGATFHGSTQRAYLGFDDLIRIPVFAPNRAIEAFEDGLTPLVAQAASVADARDALDAELIAAAGDYLRLRRRYGITDSEALDARDMLRSDTLALVASGATARSL